MSNPFYDPTDPFGFQRERELREQQARTGNTGGGCGVFGLPLFIPVFLLFGGLLYPVTGIASLLTWFLTYKLALLFGLKGYAPLIAAWIPTLPVMWLLCRWDTLLSGSNKVYRRIRHVARLLGFAGLLIFISGVDSPANTTDMQVIRRFFHTPGSWGVALVILAVLHFALVSESGVIKTFWHALLGLMRLRPLGLGN